MIIGVDYKKIFDDSKSINLVSGSDIILAELTMLLNFQKYSLFFGNNIGLDLEKYIQLRNREATFNLIKSDIEQLFIKYKRAYLKSIDMKFNDDSNTIEITLYVTIDKNSSQVFSIPLVLSN